MRQFVDHILAPYFEETKVKLGRPPSQRSLWMIDVWSVHRSDEFRAWMYKYHSNILVDFVPGGCTGVAQPCDVGIQRPFKHITNQCYLEDVVDATLTQLDKGEEFTMDDRLPTLRNASVRWLWTAYEALNKKEIVQKVSYLMGNDHGYSPRSQAFQLCMIKQWNLSHENLRSFEMQEKLREIRTTNDPFWIELNHPNAHHLRPPTDSIVPEDIMPDPEDEEDLDDSDVGLRHVIADTHKSPAPKQCGRISKRDNGGLMMKTDAEDIDKLPESAEDGKEEEGRGKRKKIANAMYDLSDFTRHWDNEASDVE
jgi:hypothetical protein